MSEVSYRGPWGPDQVSDYLAATVIPLRLATSGRSGPMVQSMWFRFENGLFYLATPADSLVVRRLQADPRCGFEVAGDDPPYRGVRGTGSVLISDDTDRAVLGSLVVRYLGSRDTKLGRWLLGRTEPEVAITIWPTSVTSWDFTTRMSD